MSEEFRGKRPAFQFYPGDWRRDTGLQSCSLEARGLWIEMLCLMHDGEPYGTLRVGSTASPIVPKPDGCAGGGGSTSRLCTNSAPKEPKSR